MTKRLDRLERLDVRRRCSLSRWYVVLDIGENPTSEVPDIGILWYCIHIGNDIVIFWTRHLYILILVAISGPYRAWYRWKTRYRVWQGMGMVRYWPDIMSDIGKKHDIGHDFENIVYGKERVCHDIVTISAPKFTISGPISGKMTRYRVMMTRYRKMQYRDIPDIGLWVITISVLISWYKYQIGTEMFCSVRCSFKGPTQWSRWWWRWSPQWSGDGHRWNARLWGPRSSQSSDFYCQVWTLCQLSSKLIWYDPREVWQGLQGSFVAISRTFTMRHFVSCSNWGKSYKPICRYHIRCHIWYRALYLIYRYRIRYRNGAPWRDQHNDPDDDDDDLNGEW